MTRQYFVLTYPGSSPIIPVAREFVSSEVEVQLGPPKVVRLYTTADLMAARLFRDSREAIAFAQSYVLALGKVKSRIRKPLYLGIVDADGVQRTLVGVL